MLQPKKTKFRRQQKGRMKGEAQRGNQLAFGSFGIKALENKWITGRQIEAARIAVTRYMQRQGQVRSEERRVGKECRSRWSPYH